MSSRAGSAKIDKEDYERCRFCSRFYNTQKGHSCW